MEAEGKGTTSRAGTRAALAWGQGTCMPRVCLLSPVLKPTGPYRSHPSAVSGFRVARQKTTLQGSKGSKGSNDS
jgi:hypothetical protein